MQNPEAGLLFVVTISYLKKVIWIWKEIFTCFFRDIKLSNRYLKSIPKFCAVNDKSVLFWPVFQPFVIIIFLFERLNKALCFRITQMKILVKQIAKKRRRKMWIFEPGKFHIQNVHRWNPHNLKRSKIYSLMGKYPIL